VSLPAGGIPGAIQHGLVTFFEMLRADAVMFDKMFTDKVNSSSDASGVPVDDGNDDIPLSGDDDCIALAKTGQEQRRLATVRAYSRHITEIVSEFDDGDNSASTREGDALNAAALELSLGPAFKEPSPESVVRAAAAAESSKNTISLGTIHSAKGGQWPHVFIARAIDGEMPMRNLFAPVPFFPPSSQDSVVVIDEETPAASAAAPPTDARGIIRLVMDKENIHFAASFEEEQRVFYVAASRAQERLYVTRPSNNSDAVPAGTAPDDWPQSPFLAMIQPSTGTAFLTYDGSK
jgi:superfamily I DNA/RNA helicase